MILRAKDALDAGLCVSGQKLFCESHGIDFRSFIRNGIDIAELEHIEDSNLAKAIEAVKNREAANG